MGDPLKVLKPGTAGVILDPHPLSEDIPDNALTLSQNASHDPLSGHQGALRKRAGLLKFNTSAAAGSILGGIMVPLPSTYTGGAPAPSFTGITGSNTGSGDGSGAPGATSDGSSTTTTPPGASAFNGGSTIFGGARLLLIGRDNNTSSNAGGIGWFTTSKNLADTSLSGVVTPGPPVASYSYPGANPFYNHLGRPFAIITLDGVTWLYYAATNGSQATTPTAGAPIRRTNGSTDELVGTIPLSSAANANRCVILSMQTLPSNTSIDSATYRSGNIVICVKDKFNNQATAGMIGRVFILTTPSHKLYEINTGSSYSSTPPEFDVLPYVIDGTMPNGAFPNRVFFGEYIDGASATGARIYCSEPYATTAADGSISYDLTKWRTDVDKTFATGDGTVVSCMENYNGRIWAATSVNTSGTPTLGFIYTRRPDTVAGSTGTNGWVALSHTALNAEVAANGNGYLSMAKFGTNLYVSWYAQASGHGHILKVTATNAGDYTSSSFTVTSVLDDSLPYWLFVDDGVLYAISVDEFSGTFSTTVKTTTDGTTWSADKSGKIPNQGNLSRPIPVLCGFAQS